MADRRALIELKSKDAQCVREFIDATARDEFVRRQFPKRDPEGLAFSFLKRWNTSTSAVDLRVQPALVPVGLARAIRVLIAHYDDASVKLVLGPGAAVFDEQARLLGAHGRAIERAIEACLALGDPETAANLDALIRRTGGQWRSFFLDAQRAGLNALAKKPQTALGGWDPRKLAPIGPWWRRGRNRSRPQFLAEMLLIYLDDVPSPRRERLISKLVSDFEAPFSVALVQKARRENGRRRFSRSHSRQALSPE